MQMKLKFDEYENIDNLLITRRLAQFCPTSLSIDDFKSRPKKSTSSLNLNSSISSAENLIDESKKIEYIQPSPVVKIDKLSSNISESKSDFKLGIQPSKHRFGFLLEDIKPINNKIKSCNSCSNLSPRPSKKMRYELPNVKKVDTPIKSTKPLMIVSFSSSNLTNNNNKLQSPRNAEKK